VIGSFFASDNPCPHCRHGYQTSCMHKEFVVGAQAPFQRVPLADGTLVALKIRRGICSPTFRPCPTCSAPAGLPRTQANVQPGMTVAVVGDGAVGLLGLLSPKVKGAERIIARWVYL
jgi:threonine dehydrogenase-like Zn-dependent dehydrogenase